MSSQNEKGQNIFQVHSFRCLFLQLAAEKKTPKTVHRKFFFGPSYFEMVLVKSMHLLLYPTSLASVLFLQSTFVLENLGALE